jgi:endonuclease/exonuclease/phosphatase family metal-dependent hydrolase
VIGATYNVHRCIGSDGRHDPDRVAAVIRELDADVVGLQEVDAKPHVEAGLDQVVYLAEATGLTGIAGPTLVRHYGEYGNALLTRLPVRGVTLIDLSVARREPRGAIDAEVDAHGIRCRILVTHLGLRRTERNQQLAHLIAAPPRWPGPALTVLLGDLNDWLGIAGLGLRLPDGFVYGRVRSFPARAPVLRLDAIAAHPADALRRVWAQTTRLARVASDHLPVCAELHPTPPVSRTPTQDRPGSAV